MLPKISAALGKFISPVRTPAPAGSNDSTQQQQQQGKFKRATPEKVQPEEPKPQPPLAAVIPIRKREDSALPPFVPPTSHPFLQLMTMLGSSRNAVFRWLGAISYRSALKRRRGSFRKGTILDQRAE